MVKPKKSLGQNFLIDKNTIKKIINTVDIKNQNVIEIGPGTGNLTKEIVLRKPKSIVLIEKDKQLYFELMKLYEKNKNIRIINKDILDLNLETLIKSKTTIFGNLPYNISTKIFTNLIKFKNWPPKYSTLILMFQKEVADKIKANFNTSNYGRLSIISDYRLNIIKNFEISNNCFFPKPKVKSTLIVFKPKNINNHLIKNLNNLEKITSAFFTAKRKMVNKVIKKIFYNNKKIDKLKIDGSFRPSQITPKQFYLMTEIYEKN